MYQRASDALPLLLAVLFTLCLSVSFTTATCDYTGRPHPRGFCGRTLAILRQNVCHLLRIRHPEYFGTTTTNSTSVSSGAGEKRSAALDPTRLSEHQSFSKMLHMLKRALEPAADLDRLEQRQVPSESYLSLNQRGLPYLEEKTQSSLESWPGAEMLSGNTMGDASVLSELLKGRAKRAVTGAFGQALARRKRNLVCECCYNECTIERVALYC